MRLLFQLLTGLVIGIIVCWLYFSRGHNVMSSHHEVVEKVESLGKLELVRMNIRDVMEHQFTRTWLPNASALLIISGEAAGCIDLQKIRPEDVLLIGDTLKLRLPQPEICYCKINHSKSKVYETKYDYFTGTNLVDDAYREAETHLRKTVLEAGILEQTKQNASLILKPFFETLGFKHVEISF